MTSAKQQAVDAAVVAIEVFTDASISYDSRRREWAEFASSNELNEAREEMRKALWNMVTT